MFANSTASRYALLILLLLGATTLRAWTGECSLGTLNGSYAFLTQGTLLIAPQPPFASTGVVVFDGQGNFSGTYTQSVGGAVTSNLKLEGTYQVNADCTLSATLSTGAHRVGVITGEGMQQELHLIFTDPSSVAYVTYRKTPQGHCSLATLKGKYGLFGNGTVLSPGAPPILVAQTGLLSFDGTGAITGVETTNTAGVVASKPVTGTYAVNSDCTASLILHLADEVVREDGAIAGQGRFKQFQGIVTNQGWVFTSTLKRQ